MTIQLPPALSRQLASLGTARHLLVCSDYDGTLAPLASHPSQARLLPGALDILHDLAGLSDTRVAIISGRSREDLRAHSGLGWPVQLAGSHGAELPLQAAAAPDAEQQAKIDRLEGELVRICAISPGAWTERKPLGLAVHVREANPTDADHVLAAVRHELARWPGAHITEGKAVLEASFSYANKGDAVRWFRDDWGTKPQVLYLGDDVTDEAAFGALDAGDIGIKVGAGPTRAAYRVDSELAALAVLGFVLESRASMKEPHFARQPHRGQTG